MKKIGLNVLSLFDGISGGQQAFFKLFKQIEFEHYYIKNYYSVEIDKYAIAITKYNFPKTIFLGSVEKLNYKDIDELENIDILIGGSPCQGFSFAGKRKGAITKENIEITTLNQYLRLKEENFEFSGQSYLFWEYIRILKYLQNKNKNLLFLLENVVMLPKWKNIFDKTIGCEPILIDSALLSAQQRKRFYWTNLCNNIKQPNNKFISLYDILEDNIKLKNYNGSSLYIDKYNLNKGAIRGRRIDDNNKRVDKNLKLPIVQCLEVTDTINSNILKSNCITTVEKDNILTPLNKGRYIDVFNKFNSKSTNKYPYRYYTLVELERLQTLLKDNYTKYGIFNIKGKNIIKEISKSQRIKSIGNGWTVDVIVYLLHQLLSISRK